MGCPLLSEHRHIDRDDDADSSRAGDGGRTQQDVEGVTMPDDDDEEAGNLEMDYALIDSTQEPAEKDKGALTQLKAAVDIAKQDFQVSLSVVPMEVDADEFSQISGWESHPD